VSPLPLVVGLVGVGLGGATLRLLAPGGAGLLEARQARVLAAVSLGVLEGLLAWRLPRGGGVGIATWAVFALLGVALFALSVVDLATRRLPRAPVLATGAGLFVALCGLAGLTGAGWERLGIAVAWGVGLFVAFLAVHLASPTSFGGGDVRLAGVVGLAAGWWGVPGVLVALVVTFVGTGLVGVPLARRSDEHFVVLGPWLALGAVVAATLHG
jgi:leader peptidase (prepilin peptidase)/N-methyltransferase